ncbi:MAG: hypothetical protein A2297_03830 [Elusimicrobia bacterium RIFOXYB2_FULL_48_7]|nr:MAG: hypothetical protein A2297_03830 [Elusimicrobia bacterium RIFOXYB2_FULL_48_7]
MKVINLGLTKYEESWNMQKKALAERIAGKRPDTLFLVEHPPVITFGRGKKDDTDILVSPEYLKKRGVKVVEVDRGGSVTLHCPGQLVGYAIIGLADGEKDIHEYIRKLEEVIIRMLVDYGISAQRREGFTGVWVGEKKIASIGVGVKHWVTYHGFALNVNPDMSVVSMIHPCGLKNRKMTSIAELMIAAPRQAGLAMTNKELMREARGKAEKYFKEIFGCVQPSSPWMGEDGQVRVKFPYWIKRRVAGSNDKFDATRKILNELKLNTVCDSATCPNINECFSNKTATFMILGKNCTRSCGFCSVGSLNADSPEKVDRDEPKRVAQAVKKLKLRHVVVTSVTRDDLADGGAGQFAEVIKEIRKTGGKKTAIELLVPDFMGNLDSIKKIVSGKPEIIGHNLETVPRLYTETRPQADYRRSLELLKNIKVLAPGILTKSGIMLGLGEKKEEVMEVLKDLREADCDIATLGQYLRPSKQNIPVKEFITPEEFENYEKTGEKMGFKAVVSGPFVRSSYHAREAYTRRAEKTPLAKTC